MLPQAKELSFYLKVFFLIDVDSLYISEFKFRNSLL